MWKKVGDVGWGKSRNANRLKSQAHRVHKIVHLKKTKHIKAHIKRGVAQGDLGMN